MSYDNTSIDRFYVLLSFSSSSDYTYMNIYETEDFLINKYIM